MKALIVALGLIIGFSPAAACASSDDPSQYTYVDTQRLVELVNAAADLIHTQGRGAFAQFGRQGSRWLSGDLYLFVYTLDGTSVFHPVSIELVGKHLMALRDMNGKPVIRLITDIGRERSPDASGWVFYLWEDQTQLTPLWKTSFIRKAIAPDGTVYVVGAGLYNMKTEKLWVQDRVDEAMRLMQQKGTKVAFKAFLDPASQFVFLNSYVFVLDPQLHTVIDPAFPTNAGRDLSGFRDYVGTYVMRELAAKLRHSDAAWVQYLFPQPGEALPSRKVIYARKVTVAGKTYIVGSDFFLATPIWMHL